MSHFRSALVLVAALAISFPGEAGAQVCRRGKPCGNSCIAQNKTCRVGQGTARAAPSTPAATARPSTQPVRDAAPAESTPAIPDGAAFVASSRGRVYYWVGCSSWRSLSRANLRWFTTRADAESAGYTPSQARGCDGPGLP